MLNRLGPIKILIMWLVASTSLLLPVCAESEELSLEILTLRYRSADEVIPILQPLISKDGSISGLQNQLILRTTPANLAEIKKVLSTIDRQARSLMITVRQNATVTDEESGVELTGTVAVGKRANVSIPDSNKNEGLKLETSGGGSQVKARVFSTDSVDADKNMQRLRVVEGRGAYIRFGQSIPVPQRIVTQDGHQVNVVDTLEYRDVITGFYVVPRLNGDQVTLDISPQRDTVGATGNINIQRLNTTFSGKLGQWIDAGGVINSESDENTSLGTRSVRTRGDQRTVLIKVEEVD